MGFDLEQPTGMDPHVEISREELELGLPPSIVSDTLSEMQDSGYRISTPAVFGTGNSKFLGADPIGSIRAPSASATDLQQAEMAPAAFDPGSHVDIMSWSKLSTCEVSLEGTDGEDLLATFNLNLRSGDEVQHGETAIVREPLNAVGASFTILPMEGLTEDKHEASKESSPEITRHGNDAPICRESEHAKYQGEVVTTAAKPVNDSNDDFLQKEVFEPLDVELPEVPPELPSVHGEHANGKGCAETELSGPIEGAQRLQSECTDPDFGSGVMPASFSGLFQSVLASDIPSSQLVETGSESNGLTGATATVPTVTNQAVTNIVNTTTSLILASLKQAPFRPDPPGLLQAENALVSRSRMKPNTVVAALEARPVSLSTRSASQTSYRAARVASAATKVSAAASAAKSAVQAAEASIEALANLGINNGSLYQGRNSFVNPQPLKVASASTPVAAGVKRKFQGQRSPVVKQTGGMETTGTLDLIKVGSSVEVMPAEDGLQCGWFIAKVLSKTSKQAVVVYDDLMTDDVPLQKIATSPPPFPGNGLLGRALYNCNCLYFLTIWRGSLGCSNLEESFPLHWSREENSFGTTVLPAQGWIRPVHPFSSSQKRGHFITVYENWVVGDRVDAFVEDGWWEAIIEDLNETDETNITVFFPGDGSTTVVKAWNVRPSLVWKKGEWRPCRGDSVEQAYPPSKRQKTSSNRGRVEREHIKTTVAADGNPVLPHKKTPEPLATSQAKRSGSSRNDQKGMVIYSKERHSEQSLVTPARELRSATRSNANVAQTKVPVKSSTAPVPKTRIANARASMNGSSPLTRSQQKEAAVLPELTWDVRRQSTRLQQKEVSPNPRDLGKGKTLSSRLSKKEMLESAKDNLRRKTPSRRSQHKEVMKTPVGNDLAIVLLPETRSRTRSQKKR